MQTDQKMAHQQTNETSDSVPPCEKGHEVVSPRDMVAYLRANEEKTEKLPPGMQDHVDVCSTCSQNWSFIQRTDPVVRQFREERVKLIMQHVLAEEIILAAPANGESDSQAGEREARVQEVQQDLSQTQAALEDTSPQLDIPVAQNLRFDDVLRVCESVRRIPDDKQRFEKANELAMRFAKLVEEFAELAEDEKVALFDALMQLKDDSVDLYELKEIKPKVTAGIAAAFIASFPETSYFRDTCLLEHKKSRKSDKILFHRGRFPELVFKFDEVRAKFEAQA